MDREFFERDANALAPALLGKLLVHRTAEGVTAGMIVEVEAYKGRSDKGCHAWPMKRTPRTEVLFGPGGHAYVYAIYGMHSCFNVTANVTGEPDVVFVRALAPVSGLALMCQRRGVSDVGALCSGPGRLCQAMGITKALYGADLLGDTLWLEEFRDVAPAEIMVSPRVNIDYAEECRDYPWRYFIKDEPCVSKVAKRFRVQERGMLE